MESLIRALLRRPVAMAAFYLLVLALAVVALFRLPVALLPSLRYPSLVVWTAYPDVAPEQVEKAVTEPVEEAVAGAAGLAGVTSRSQLGGSLVRLDFGWNADLDLAAIDVREKLDRLGGLLPERAERPLVLRIDPSDRPIMVLAVGLAGTATGASPPVPDLLRLKQAARDVVARRLEQLDGVARVRVTGGYEPEIEVAVSPARAAAYGIDLEKISGALRDANVSLAGGVVRRGPFRYAVEVSGELRDAGELAATIVSEHGQPPVRLYDVAEVREGTTRRRGLVRLDGGETLLLLVERRPDANTVQTARAVRDALGDLRAQLPGVRLAPVVDESVFIESAISGVVQSLIGGAVLTVMILLVFLRRPRALLAAAVAVPLSLALTLVLFELFGISFNLISLSGLALGVGLLLDNSTVVVENIARLRESGMDAWKAACRGTAEVAGPITASTLTTVAVFLPITFVEGLAGRLFRDQSLAIVCSVLSSLLVALTAVPLIAARDRTVTPDFTGQAGGLTLRLYERLLDVAVRRRWATLAATGLLLALTAAMALRLPREIVPEEEEGRVQVSLTLPTDADVELVSERAREIEAAAARWPEVRHVLADLGERDDARLDLEPRPVYRGDLTLVLAPGKTSADVLPRLRGLGLSPDIGIEARPVRPQLDALLAGSDVDLEIDLTAGNRSDAERSLGPLMAALRGRRELVNLARTDPEAVPAYRVELDRDAVARFGVRPPVLQTYLEAAARGREATRLRSVNDEIPVVLHAAAVDSIERLLAERIPAASGLLPLGSFVRAEAVQLPAVLLRSHQGPIVRLTADTAPGATLQDAVRAVEETAERAALPPSVRVRVGGANESFRSSLIAVGQSLLLSLLLVYLILAAQFESLLQPLVILSAVPLAAVGIVFCLALTGQSWNLMSLTACVVVVGIVDNDAIVKVDFINQARRSGLSLVEAIRAAGRNRFRPIVMNTLTTVLGLLPMSLGLGQGGGLQASLAITIVGGLLSATALTLVVVPVIYMLVDGGAERLRTRRPDPRRGEEDGTEPCAAA
ncbi:MAG TPA: efflux RND transporter permease subunit [Thermoanaerobaculia bacterium]